VQISGDGITYANTDCYSMDGLTTFTANGWITAPGTWRCNVSGAAVVKAVLNSGSPTAVKISANASMVGNVTPAGSVGSLYPVDVIPSMGLYNSSTTPVQNPIHPIGGRQVLLITATGDFNSSTFSIQTSTDGQQFEATDCYSLDGGTTYTSTTWLAAEGVFRCNVSGATSVKAVLASGTPGTLKITGTPSVIGFARPPGSGGGACGSDTEVTFNDAGACGTDSSLTYDKGTDTLSSGSVAATVDVTIGGTSVCQEDGTNCPTSVGGGHTIENEGTPLTQRNNLNFVGTAVNVTDDDPDTTVTITESDPIVGAITGIVKADGGGNIAAAAAGTDYVSRGAATTYTSGKQDFGAVTIEVPNSAGFTPAAPGEFGLDSTTGIPKIHDGTASQSLAYLNSNTTGSAGSLASNPTDCTITSTNVGVFAHAIDAQGNLTCKISRVLETRDPDENDDSGDGYIAGVTRWCNSAGTENQRCWDLIDSTVAAAVWDQAAGGAGDVTLAGNNTFTGVNTFTGANNLGNSVRIGDGVTPMCGFTDATHGPLWKPCTDADRRTLVPVGFTWALWDEDDDSAVIIANPDATATGTGTLAMQGNHKFVGGAQGVNPGSGAADPTAQVTDGDLFYRTDTDALRVRVNGSWANVATAAAVKSIFIPAAYMKGSASCTDQTPTEKALPNDDILTINPADDNACRIKFSLPMPATWNAGTVTLTMHMFSATASLNDFAVDWGGDSYAPGNQFAAVTDPTAANVQATCTFNNQTEDYMSCTTAPITIANTPAAGDWVTFTGDVDATATDYEDAFTGLHLIGISINATY
jgi:hypothetical protein